jgi:hypothetical protein
MYKYHFLELFSSSEPYLVTVEQSLDVSSNSPIMLQIQLTIWSRDAQTGLTFNNYTLCPHCIYVFCIYLRTNSDLCHLQHKLTGFYNRDKKCLQRGTDWVFK